MRYDPAIQQAGGQLTGSRAQMTSWSSKLAGSLVCSVIAFCGSFSWSMDSTEVLPEAINSPSVRMGFVSGIGMRFLSSGDLMTLTDINSIEFDAKRLATFEPRVNQLINVLNQFGSLRLGDQLNLGTLKVDTTPEVQYYAPVFARGINARWTVALGVPIVTYKNRIRMSQTGGNVDSIRSIVGNGSQDITDALDKMTRGLALAANDAIAAKGYRRLADRSDTMVGDVQVASLIQFAKEEVNPGNHASALLKTIVTLPTGPGDDPDDLADLAAFGYTAIENQLIGNYNWGRWIFGAKGGFRYTLPDRLVKRVPIDENDSLPGTETKQIVERAMGSAIFAGATVTYGFSDAFNASVGVELTRKRADRYSGTSNSRYDLLAKDSQSESDRIRAGFTYSTVESFLAGKSWLPTVIAYEFSDTLRGVNTERMTVHEIWLQLFF